MKNNDEEYFEYQWGNETDEYQILCPSCGTVEGRYSDGFYNVCPNCGHIFYEDKEVMV